MATIINPTVFAGEDVTLTLYARNRSNAALSLTGSAITWRVGRGPLNLDSPTAVFSKSGNVTDSENGVFTVSLGISDTQYMEGDYTHEAWVTNASAQVSVVAQGRLRIKPYLTS